MLKSAFALSTCACAWVLFAGCGTPLYLGAEPSMTNDPADPIPSGALLYLDASYITGTYAPPPTSCTSTWIDLSGNSENGSLTGFSCSSSTAWTGDGSTTAPYALDFDSAGYVTTNLDVQPSVLADTTWEIWVKPTRLNFGTRQQILSDDDGGFDRSLLIEANTTMLSAFTGSTGGGVWSPVTADLDQWQHVALVYTASDILMYKNGTQFDFGSAFGGAGTTTKKLNIGANPAFGEKLQGQVALFAVYNRALSASEISTHCKAYQPRFSGVTCN